MLTANKNDNTMEKACCSAKEAGQKVREIFDHASHDARNAVAVTEKQIRSNPLAASAIAAGIGFLAGALFRRR